MGKLTCSKAIVSLCFLGVTGLGIYPLQAISQDAAQESGLALEEVMVTATKRAESLQDVPISIGVVSGDMISKFDIMDPADLQSFVPGLTIQETFGSWAVRIRGLGSGITNLAFDSSVPVFNDGVYCGRGKCMESMFLDLDRVEVARGPQGALFGKSTMAGAIVIVSKKPTEEFESYLRGGYEVVDGGWKFDGALSGPISDTFRARAAFKYENLDGWVTNPYVDYKEPQQENFAGRVSFEWDVSENTMVSLKLETGDDKSKGRSNQLVVPGLMSLITTDPNPEYVPDDIRRVSTAVGREDYYDYKWSLATLTVDSQIGDHTLTGILGYWKYKNDWRLDVDGGPQFALNTDLHDKYDQTTAELRLLSPTGKTLDYMVGIQYQTSDLTTNQHSPFSAELGQFLAPILLPPFLVPILSPPDEVGGTGSDRWFSRDQNAWSAYGQLVWNITNSWRLIGDLRYTDESQDGIGQSFSSNYPDQVNPVHVPKRYLFHIDNYLYHQNRSDSSWDPSIRLQWDVTDNAMVYLGWSQGSKPGGLKANDGNLGTVLLQNCAADPTYCPTYVGQPTVTPADLAAGLTLEQGNGTFDFEDEQGESWEIGTKLSFADGRANLNLAIYSMNFSNLQTSSYDGTRFLIQNAASASVDGFELESSWQATSSLRLGGALAYVDATYDDFPGAQCLVAPDHGLVNPGCVDGQENLAGYRLERSPKWEANLDANWQSALSDNLVLFANLAFYYSGDYWVRQDFDPHGRQDSYTKWDARVAIASSDDQWEIAVSGRNLTNEYTIQHAYEILGDEFQTLSQGRTVTFYGTYRWF